MCDGVVDQAAVEFMVKSLKKEECGVRERELWDERGPSNLRQTSERNRYIYFGDLHFFFLEDNLIRS